MSRNLSKWSEMPNVGTVNSCVRRFCASTALSCCLFFVPIHLANAQQADDLRGTLTAEEEALQLLLRPEGQIPEPGAAVDADLEEAADPTVIPASRRGPVSEGVGLPSERPDEERPNEDPFADPLQEEEEAETAEDLEELRRGQSRARRADFAQSTGPTQIQRDLQTSDDPYAPLGIRIGTFTLRPTLDLGLTGISTRGFSATPTSPSSIFARNEEGVFAEAALSFEAQSDWSRHALDIEGSARWQEGLRGSVEAEPEFALSATGRYDISSTTNLTGTLGYAFQLEEAASANIVSTGSGTIVTQGAPTPSQQTFEAGVTLTHDIGSLFGSIGGTVARNVYGDVELNDGSSISQTDLDNTLYTAALRGGFQASPVFRPFAELEIAARVNDQSVDGSGFARDSIRYTARVGSELDFGEKLRGEVAVGYFVEAFEDARLDNIENISLAAALDWSPRRGSVIALGLSTDTETSGRSNVSGSTVYTADAVLTQEIRRNLSATLGASLQYNSAVGPQFDTKTVSASAGFEYRFNRNVGLIGNYTHERIFSPDKTEQQVQDNLFLGLRLQR